jgi:GTP:adenosylcobinamide-phosphate guanylyltransferase
MAGGRSSRLKIGLEKPLLSIRGEAMLKKVINALRSSRYVNAIFVAVSKWTPNTRWRPRSSASSPWRLVA